MLQSDFPSAWCDVLSLFWGPTFCRTLASRLLPLEFAVSHTFLVGDIDVFEECWRFVPVPPLGLSDVFLLSKTGCGSWGGQPWTPSARLTPADGTSLPWPRGCLPVLPLQSYPFLLPLLTSAFGRKVTMCRPWVRSEGSCFASWGHSSYINHLGFCTGGLSVLPTY